MINKITVPDIGDFESVEIIEILVKKGDQIKKNDSIVTLESDKSSVEVPSTEEGIVETIDVNIGDKDKIVYMNNLNFTREVISISAPNIEANIESCGYDLLVGRKKKSLVKWRIKKNHSEGVN